nr:polyprenyl synthetase family protein [Micromonospora sp. DSM 115978]
PPRRGRPAVHRRLAALHRDSGWRGDADRFGRSAAVLLGDAFLAWADEMLVGSGLPPSSIARAWPVYADMRTELVAGQYLDLVGQAAGRVDSATATKIARYKTAGYTVQRPLQLGGTLAGAPAALLDAYRAFGLLVGEAFQLRDDVLGAFGDPAETGKPSGDDLRDGKRTALLAATLSRCTHLQACRVEALLRRCDRHGDHPTARSDRNADDRADQRAVNG